MKSEYRQVKFQLLKCRKCHNQYPIRKIDRTGNENCHTCGCLMFVVSSWKEPQKLVVDDDDLPW